MVYTFISFCLGTNDYLYILTPPTKKPRVNEEKKHEINDKNNDQKSKMRKKKLSKNWIEWKKKKKHEVAGPTNDVKRYAFKGSLWSSVIDKYPFMF